VWLALASALVVLLASGVAISRMSERNAESPVATGPSSTSSSLPGLGQPGPAVGSGPATAAGVGGMAEQAAQAAGGAASDASAVTGHVDRTTRKATGNAGGAGTAAAAGSPATGGRSPAGSTSPEGSSTSGGGPSGGGQGSPPAPSQNPPEKPPLASAAVSVGHGAEGAVVGLALGNERPADPDVTIGTNPVVGDHPPSEGTGVTFGGRFLHPPPSLPAPPG